MNIQLNNFGPIKKFDFDLSKDLTIVFGKNNIGKSYAISAIYLILKNLRSDQFIESPIDIGLYIYRRENRYAVYGSNKVIKDIVLLEETVSRQIQQENNFEITNELKKIFATIINDYILSNLEKSFKNSYSSLEDLKNKLSKKRLSIILKFKSFEFTIAIVKNKMVIGSFKFYEKIIISKTDKNKKSVRKDGEYVLYYNSLKKNKAEITDNIFLEYYMSFKNEIIEVLNNIYFLPASRSGLYQALSAFNAVIAELSKSRNFLSSKLELPNISEPVLDYFLSLANVNDKNVSKKFSEIVKLLETKILGGRVAFNEKTRNLIFLQNGIDNELDLAYTSSMISEIAPIAAFLKYVISDNYSGRFRRFHVENPNAKRGSNLIFIEEPEAHLHPEIQVKLMEIFCEIIKYDVKIVMTSHSNYMFNKLSNLVLDSTIPYSKVGSYLMLMEEEGSVSDKISMAADEDGMIDNNFADVAEELYNERIANYEKLNSNAN